jgi:hypothetical protein
LETLVFEAIAAPIKASNDRKEAESATKKAAAKAKKEERLAKGEPKLMDVVGSYNGLYAGGDFPERVLQVEQTAERAVKETAERRQQRQASKKSKVLADLVGARKRIEDGGKPFPTVPQMRAVVLAYRKHKEVSETTLNDLSKLMKSLPSTKPEYDLVLTEAGDEGIPWLAMGVLPVHDGLVEGGGEGLMTTMTMSRAKGRERKKRGGCKGRGYERRRW